MTVILAKTAGFCFGVRRAVRLCEEAAEKYDSVKTLGPIIHNESVTKALAEKGVQEVASVDEIRPGDTVIIRSHGVPREQLEKLESLGVRIIDATCPDVAKIHSIVQEQAAQGRFIAVIGEKEHPEVRAICSRCGEHAVFPNLAAFKNWLDTEPEYTGKPISVVFQTTYAKSGDTFSPESLKKEYTNLEIFDTICNATSKRQEEAVALSRTADVMVVIGGRSSSNSHKLAALCRQHCPRVQFIETAHDLDLTEFCQSDTVGITAGASTPAWIIKEVYQTMSEEILEMSGQAEPETTESFAEMLEKSFKTLNNGEKVTGVVAAITPTEISVDLGTKHSGYIPIAELTDDPTAKVEDLVKVGEEIEAFVLRVNDMEGTVMLSKKRLDAVKNWEEIDKAREEKTIVEGFVTEENKGGLVAMVKGVRVFIPMTQTGLGRDVPLSTLVKTKVRLRITEVNHSRRRVVGSIKSVLMEERRALAEKTWAEIEEGKKYLGTVKSMTSYGAFVDIGGVDGMVHVSELSWTRINQPSDILNVGDQIEVYVISFDTEKKKISLGYKTEETNPWNLFTKAHQVGDVVNVKVVKLMPFGAFAEIIPGVDGLIHISQITDHRIGLPSEILSEGQTVDVKITDIDMERHKVSLSIRALMEDARYGVAAPVEADVEDDDVADESDSGTVSE
ncbi:MAG TPA: bifunctional 4-hydroxy-3-methylbut-2-enyl diphosphate reductase/30S ribosomal protein S1 [Papillibacter sp.]|jgi:4-hydroxy-3-methylbut-2-enyl diphosphate reductase|nr:bifunctional 4-hydroxy-3-methylbut-2-enyl diphosphate reductase/30S ribosomal protein S1 [Papillibacter sp.]